MLKSNVSYSTDKDSFTAGKACAEKAVVDLIETKVAFVFSSVKYNQNKLLEGAKSESGFAGMLAIGDDETAVGVAGSERGKNPRETGKKVAKEAMAKVGTDKAPAYVYMMASPG